MTFQGWAMAYELDRRLVVGIASTALFDLSEADSVFRAEGEQTYRDHQEQHHASPLAPGVAFSFIRRLLGLNNLADHDDGGLVEVIVLSRNDPESGLRVRRSIEHHQLVISRGVFTQGRSPFEYIPAFNMSLFLSANEDDVRSAIACGHPAGRVLDGQPYDDGSDALRIAFDFDCVLADDQSESVYREQGLQAFLDHESSTHEPLGKGLLRSFLAAINTIQKLERDKQLDDALYEPRVRVALVTARSGAAIERAVRSLKSWGVSVNDGFFLGGVEKARVIEQLRPHIFFDDQLGHLNPAAHLTTGVHVPFGGANIPGQRVGASEAVLESGPTE